MDESLQPVNPFLERYLAIRHDPDGDRANTNMIKHPQSAVLREAGLDNVDCDKCDNIGQIPWMDENRIMHCRECECMKRRRSIRRLENSGLKKMVQRYSDGIRKNAGGMVLHLRKTGKWENAHLHGSLQLAAGCRLGSTIFSLANRCGRTEIHGK